MTRSTGYIALLAVSLIAITVLMVARTQSSGTVACAQVR